MPATIAVRVRRIEPQVEYTLTVSPEVRSRCVSPLARGGARASAALTARVTQTPLAAFRELLAEQSGVPVAQQRLIFRGQVLANVSASGAHNTLQACGVVEDGDTLHLVIRADVPPPAAQAPQQPHTNSTLTKCLNRWSKSCFCGSVFLSSAVSTRQRHLPLSLSLSLSLYVFAISLSLEVFCSVLCACATVLCV